MDELIKSKAPHKLILLNSNLLCHTLSVQMRS
jgi:hypothetical protein